MKITKREILFSVIILIVMLIIGFFINYLIVENNTKNNEIYYLATKIEDVNQFKYGLKTSIGNSLVYGEIKATNPVSATAINGEYFYIEKVIERYNQHTRTETYRNSKGHTQTRIVTYYSWDYEDSEILLTDKFSFMGKEFENSIDGLPVERLNLSEFAIDQSKVYSNYIYNNGFFKRVGATREYYNIVPISFTGTLEAKLYNQELKNFSSGEKLIFHNNKTINETVKSIEDSGLVWNIGFKIIWGFLTLVLIGVFCYYDNHWLE